MWVWPSYQRNILRTKAVSVDNIQVIGYIFYFNAYY